jgi:uncharacterized membrane protein YgaE (UPF0421/DUF939 family)
MVGLLIAFCVNNVIWAVFVIYLISIMQNKSLPKIFRGKNKEIEDEYEDATNEQISEHFDKFAKDVAKQTGFDENGNKVESKEEKLVE